MSNNKTKNIILMSNNNRIKKIIMFIKKRILKQTNLDRWITINRGELGSKIGPLNVETQTLYEQNSEFFFFHQDTNFLLAKNSILLTFTCFLSCEDERKGISKKEMCP